MSLEPLPEHLFGAFSREPVSPFPSFSAYYSFASPPPPDSDSDLLERSLCKPKSVWTYYVMTSSKSEYLAGMGAGVCSVAVTFPLNKVSFRQSLWGFNFPCAIRQLSLEGAFRLYRGCFPPILIKSINASVMFGAFTQYRDWLQHTPQAADWMASHPISCTAMAAMMGGTTEALLTPLERVQMILQDDRNNAQYRNTVDAFLAVRRYGLREYYRGLSSVLLRNGPATFLYFALKEPFKETLLPWGDSSGAGSRRKEAVRNFITGSVVGCAISSLFYPLNVLRIQMMTQELGSPHLSLYQTARVLYEERSGKVKLLLSGIEANLARSFLYWGCITVFSELVRDCLQVSEDS